MSLDLYGSRTGLEAKIGVSISPFSNLAFELGYEYLKLMEEGGRVVAMEPMETNGGLTTFTWVASWDRSEHFFRGFYLKGTYRF